jgi:hypothetical protein
MNYKQFLTICEKLLMIVIVHVIAKFVLSLLMLVARSVVKFIARFMAKFFGSHPNMGKHCA